MEKLTFEIKSLLKVEVELTSYPVLASKKPFIQKGIEILKKYTPKLLKYLSKEQVLANLKNYHIEVIANEEMNQKKIKQIFRLWIQKEKSKRILFIIIEALIIPFTGLLAILPGPNFFFYVPALLLYYHLVTFLSLRKVNLDDLIFELNYQE